MPASNSRLRNLYKAKRPSPYSKNEDRHTSNAMGDGISGGFAMPVQLPRSNTLPAKPSNARTLLDEAEEQRISVINDLKIEIFKPQNHSLFTGVINDNWANNGPLLSKQARTRESYPYHHMANSRQINKTRDFNERTYKIGQ